MCKARRTIVLTLPDAFVTVDVSWLAFKVHQRSEIMRGKIGLAGLVFGLCGVAASAQNITAAPYPNNVYCSGVVTTEAVPRDTFIITGEESNTNIIFSDHDYVFINKGSSKGVKVGDEFSVIRPVEDPDKFEWTKWQFSIRVPSALWPASAPMQLEPLHFPILKKVIPPTLLRNQTRTTTELP